MIVARLQASKLIHRTLVLLASRVVMRLAAVPPAVVPMAPLVGEGIIVADPAATGGM
jgi:hypothetical protein